MSGAITGGPGAVGRALPLDPPTADRAPARTSPRADLPPAADMAAADAIPTLAAPKSFDAMDLANKLLALKMKLNDEQIAGGIADVKHQGEVRKEKNAEISKKIAEAAEKAKEAAASSGIMKAFGWIAVALTVIAAVATGGALAFAAAALAVTMATLTETGVMDKMTEAIGESLMKDGMSEDDAKKWAMVFTVMIGIAVSLATLGAGAAAGAGQAAQAADKVTKIVQMGQKIGTFARYGEAAASVAEAGAGIAAGVQSNKAANAQADAMDIKKFLAKLAQQQEDEISRIQEMALGMQKLTGRVVSVIDSQAQSASNVVRHMG